MRCKICGWRVDSNNDMQDCPMRPCGYDDAVRAVIAAHVEYESWACSHPAVFLPFPRAELERLFWRVRYER